MQDVNLSLSEFSAHFLVLRIGAIANYTIQIILSRLVLKIVVMTRQEAEGSYAGGKRFLAKFTFRYILWFFTTYLLNNYFIQLKLELVFSRIVLFATVIEAFGISPIKLKTISKHLLNPRRNIFLRTSFQKCDRRFITFLSKIFPYL